MILLKPVKKTLIQSTFIFASFLLCCSGGNNRALDADGVDDDTEDAADLLAEDYTEDAVDVSLDDDPVVDDVFIDDTVQPDGEMDGHDMEVDGVDDYPPYPADEANTILTSGAGLCHTEGSPWGYAQNLSMMSISWRELDDKNVDQIADALGYYIDGVDTPTMLVIQMGGRTQTDPPQPFYPPEKEDTAGYLLNVGSISVTPDLANADFQNDLEEFLGRYGPGLRLALSIPSRRDKVLAVVGWLGSYSESHYDSAGEPQTEELRIAMTLFYELVGQVAEIPVVFHVTGRWDLVDLATHDSVLHDGVDKHHLWFKINGFNCAEPVAIPCLSETYAQTQSNVLSGLREIGANVGWEPKSPSIWNDATAESRNYAITVSREAGASFACAQRDSGMHGVMTDLITGTFQPPLPW